MTLCDFEQPPPSPPQASVSELVCLTVKAYVEGRDVAIAQASRAWAPETEA